MKEYIVTRAVGAPDWASIPAMAVDSVMWTEDFGISMTAQLSWDDTALYIRQQAVEQDIRAALTGPLDHVCEDSCMELFLCPDPADGRYFNFEINPNGCLHLGFGHGRQDSVKLLPKRAEERFCITPQRTADGWMLTYRIPLEFLRLFYPSLELKAGLVMTGNCFKCGDCTPHPHFLAWNPPTSETPDFHRPWDFGRLILN